MSHSTWGRHQRFKDTVQSRHSAQRIICDLKHITLQHYWGCSHCVHECEGEAFTSCADGVMFIPQQTVETVLKLRDFCCLHWIFLVRAFHVSQKISHRHLFNYGHRRLANRKHGEGREDKRQKTSNEHPWQHLVVLNNVHLQGFRICGNLVYKTPFQAEHCYQSNYPLLSRHTRH